MITAFEIAGFKRFSSCSLELAPLTVLAGLNGAGKTSVIQSFLLAREASLKGAKTVALNGPFGLELGRSEDVLNFDTGENDAAIRFIATFDNGSEACIQLDARNKSLLHLPIKQRPETVPEALGGPNRSFSYLCAERLGPRDVLGMSALPSDDLSVGAQGEFCAQILASHGMSKNAKVPPNRRHPRRGDEVDAFLTYQTEAWISDIVRPTEIHTVEFPGTAMTALRFRTPGGEWVRAPNMGFGVSYSLPIVLAGLFAPENSLLLIENPEAHLHPAGQSRMGTFLATMAAAGVQIITETHSDHVLNGIRRAIGEYQILGETGALVHFFEAASAGKPAASTLRFNKLGNLNDWPKSFFDQYQIDVAALSKVRRQTTR